MNDETLGKIVNISRPLFHRKVLLDQGLANHGPWSKSGLSLVFVNKVLLEHSHAHLFTYYLWLLSPCNSRVVVTDTIWPAKPQIFPVWPLTQNVCRPLYLISDPQHQRCLRTFKNNSCLNPTPRNFYLIALGWVPVIATLKSNHSIKSNI